MSFNRYHTGRECPCRDCQNRAIGCHTNCDEYVNWKKNHESILAKRFEQKKINDTLYVNQVNRNKLIRANAIKYGRDKK